MNQKYGNAHEINLARIQLDHIYNKGLDLYRPNPEQTLEMLPLFRDVIPICNKLVSHYENVQQSLTLKDLPQVEQVTSRLNWFLKVYGQILIYRKSGFQMLQRNSQFCVQANKLVRKIEQLVPVLKRNTFPWLQ